MPEVRLQAGDVVEVDRCHVLGEVGCDRLVGGAMDDAAADADVPDGRDLADRAFRFLVEAERRLERGEGELVGAKRAGERVRTAPRDQETRG